MLMKMLCVLCFFLCVLIAFLAFLLWGGETKRNIRLYSIKDHAVMMVVVFGEKSEGPGRAQTSAFNP